MFTCSVIHNPCRLTSMNHFIAMCNGVYNVSHIAEIATSGVKGHFAQYGTYSPFTDKMLHHLDESSKCCCVNIFKIIVIILLQSLFNINYMT